MSHSFFRKKEDNFNYLIERVCRNCDTHFEGKYCPRCSEKVVEAGDRSIRNFLSNILNAFTFIDGKFVRSIKRMVWQPGKMSADIASGITQPYMKPVAFFFVGNFIYFLLPIVQTFNTTLYSQMQFMPYSDYSTAAVNELLLNHDITLEAFTPLYNAASTNWSKMLLIFLSIIYFPFLFLLNYSKKNYTADHLLFATEFSSFTIFVPTILLSIVAYLFFQLGRLFSQDWNFFFNDRYLGYVAVASLIYFQVFGSRNFYAFPRWRVAVNTVLMLPVFYLVIHVYRFILFVVTMWTIKV